MNALETSPDPFKSLRRGLLDFAVLACLSAERRYAGELLGQLAETPFATQEGTLYPLLGKLRRDGLLWFPKTNARINVPVVTIHTLGDVYVPFSMEQIYKRRAMAQGTDKWLVQRAIRGVSHCDFTVEEQASAFDAMALWDQKGVKPEGDEVLDRATVAHPHYGCKFSSRSRTPNACPAS